MEQDGQSSERHRFPPVREGYDRAAVDAYLGDLAAEVQKLTHMSGELQERAQALGDELQGLAANLQTGLQRPTTASVERATPVEAPAISAEPAAISVKLPATSAEPLAAGTPAATSPPAAITSAASSPPAEDLDGARLVALNMALSGESREQTDRYLAESFQLTDRAKLLDEVYAAVEG